MKKSMMLFLAVVSIVFLTISLASAQDVIKLKAANYLPPTHPMSLLTGWFCDEVKKRTNGRVEITYHAGGTLLNPVKMYDGVVTGITDMGFSHIQYTRGRFPVTEVFDLPVGFPSGWVATQVCMDFYAKFKPKEWEDVHVLYVTTSGPLVLETIAKPVKTLEDIKGMKIRATGLLSDVVKSLGALPIPLQMPDVYESLKRGVIDGIVVDLSTLKHWKFAEVVKHVTSSWQLGTGITFYFVMNKGKWSSLPQDAQKVITEVALEAKEKQAKLWNEMDIEARELFKGMGGQIIGLTDGEVVKWKKAVEPVMDAYKKDMVSKGYKEAEVDSWLKYLRERIAYWEKEQKTKGVPAPF